MKKLVKKGGRGREFEAPASPRDLQSSRATKVVGDLSAWGRRSDNLSIVLNGISIPAVVLDTDGRVRHYTPTSKEYGLTPRDIGRRFIGFRRHVQIPDLSQAVSEVIEQGTVVWRQLHGDDDRWYRLRIGPLRNDEHEIAGALVSLRNIDDLKRKESQLQRERNFVVAILNAARDLLVVVLDPQGRIQHFNRTCQKLTGYSLEEVKGRYLCDFLIAPADIEKTKEALAGAANQSETQWLTKDRCPLLIRWSHSIAHDEAGAAEALIWTGVNQTDRAEAQQRAEQGAATIEALMQSATQGIAAIDRDGKIAIVNRTLAEMFGYQQNELLGQPVEKLIPQRLRNLDQAYRAAWFQRPSSGPKRASWDPYGLRKDGSEFPVEVSLSHLQLGEIELGVTFVADITDRMKTQEALRQHEEQLRRLTNRLLAAQESGNRQVARELHDSISQQLAALGMELSAVRRTSKIPRAIVESLGAIEKRAAQLAVEIHRTSRRLHPAVLEELGLVAALKEECRAFSQQTGLPVRFSAEGVPESIPPEIALCLYRVAQESLHNIRKHSGATAVEVRLTSDAKGLILNVDDTGDGFDVNEARKGGGLGLVTMEERVRAVNGDFTIASQPTRGTQVRVFLPVKKNKRPKREVLS